MHRVPVISPLCALPMAVLRRLRCAVGSHNGGRWNMNGDRLCERYNEWYRG